jgi:7-cyano-7-deazaguanine synthase
MTTQNAVVLLSGGLDSATTLAIACSEGYSCYCLSIDYGQRHRAEIDAARRIARLLRAAEHHVVDLDLTAFGGSALTDKSIDVPTGGLTPGIPRTYVPARNTIFLSLALAYAEVRNAADIFFGANAVDYSGYPDCRPEYMRAFESLANLATKAASEGRNLKLHTPIITLSKAEIILRGITLGVDYALTVSCYQAADNGLACGVCDSCRIRRAGFEAAGLPDPTRYVTIETGRDWRP